jgi:hypothetical protein
VYAEIRIELNKICPAATGNRTVPVIDSQYGRRRVGRHSDRVNEGRLYRLVHNSNLIH